jgi:EmrB/QacA subfamily drug resistance transporter
VKIQYKYAVALTAALALFMAVLDTTIVNVALVAMEKDFNTTINGVQWVITGYILAQAAIIPVTGYFGNRFGVKRVFMIALAIFTVGSLLCGLSRDVASGSAGLNLLIAFRVLQGIGGGMLFPLGTTIAFGAFPPEERASSSAVVAIPVLFAPALGPTVGGLIVDSGIKWPGIFFINVPVGILALILVARIVRPDERAATLAGERRSFDYAGLFLSITGVVMVVYAFVVVSQTRGGSITPQNPNGVINGWGYWPVWALLAGGVILLTIFGILETRIIEDPVLDLRLFATKDFRIASIATWAVRGLVFGSFLLIPIFLQQFQGKSAVHTGLILMAQGIGAIIGIQSGSRLYDRIGPRYLTTTGLAILAGATLWLVAVKPDSDWRFFVPILFLRGIGFGWSNLPLQTVALGSITGRALPKATSLYNAAAQIFSSIGTAVVTTILVQRTTRHASDLVRDAIATGARPPANLALIAGTAAVSDVFKLLTVGTLAAAAIALLLPRQSLKRINQQGTQAANAGGTPTPDRRAPVAAPAGTTTGTERAPSFAAPTPSPNDAPTYGHGDNSRP